MNPPAGGACAPEAFEARYRNDPDPWRFATSAYERERYTTTMNALTRARYVSAFEPGCSIGELTALLAAKCSHVFATDVSTTAVETARRRCIGLKNVRVECGDVRTVVLDAPVDLIILSELAYYFEVEQLERIATRLAHHLCVGGTLLAVHWLGESDDHILHGDEAHEVLLRSLPLHHLSAQRHPGFRLDMWMRL
ncbi:MAG TPA: SAM-dependent methyltransferase [Steroidobacteraceae bacterium]